VPQLNPKEDFHEKTMSFVFALALLAAPGAVFAQQNVSVRTVTTESAGTISEINPDTLIIRSETGSSPMNYTYTKSTTYVDDAGVPVSMETVRSGMPVTVYYTQEGDRMVATKVVVRRTTTSTETPTIERRPPRRQRVRPNRSSSVVQYGKPAGTHPGGLAGYGGSMDARPTVAAKRQRMEEVSRPPSFR